MAVMAVEVSILMWSKVGGVWLVKLIEFVNQLGEYDVCIHCDLYTVDLGVCKPVLVMEMLFSPCTCSLYLCVGCVQPLLLRIRHNAHVKLSRCVDLHLYDA